MKINIACLQMVSQPYNWDYNIEKSMSMIREASKNGVDICLLPEVFIPGYSFSLDNFKQAEPLNGPTIEILLNLAKELKIYISGSIIEKSNQNFFNTMFFIGPEGLLGIYRKIYVFGIEQKFWKKGNEISIIDSKFGAIGLGICADMHYSKLWKQYAGKVDFILISSAWPNTSHIKFSYAHHELELCKDLPVKISKTLQVPTAYCNAAHQCVGSMPFVGTITCAGYSKIVQNGEIIASTESGESIIYGDVETNEVRPKPDISKFKNWIRYSYREKIPKVFMEKIIPISSRSFYRKQKKKFLS